MRKENSELECGAFVTYCKCNDEKSRSEFCKSDLLLRTLDMNIKSGFVEIPKLETADEFYEWLHSQ